MITIYYKENLERQLRELESDKLAFTGGCRNDDIVNWALLTIAIYRVTKGGSIPFQKFIDKFNDFHDNRLTPSQRAAIVEWEEYPNDKLRICHTLYSVKTVDSIMSKWIPGHYYEIDDIK